MWAQSPEMWRTLPQHHSPMPIRMAAQVHAWYLKAAASYAYICHTVVFHQSIETHCMYQGKLPKAAVTLFVQEVTNKGFLSLQRVNELCLSASERAPKMGCTSEQEGRHMLERPLSTAKLEDTVIASAQVLRPVHPQPTVGMRRMWDMRWMCRLRCCWMGRQSCRTAMQRSQVYPTLPILARGSAHNASPQLAQHVCLWRHVADSVTCNELVCLPYNAGGLWLGAMIQHGWLQKT